MTPTRPDVKRTGRYTVSEAARLLEVSRTTIYRWIEDEELKVRVQRKTLRKYIMGAEILRLWEGDWLI